MQRPSYILSQYIIDFIYICDILRQFRTTYYSKTTGEEIFNLKLIAKHYMRHGMFIDICAAIPILPHLLPGAFSDDTKSLLNLFGFLKMWRVLRIRVVIAQTNYTKDFKAFLRILFILLLLTLYMHVIACILWKLFSQDKVWIPPKEFGELNINYMDDALLNTKLIRNYFVMVYYATFAFNLIDIAP